MHPPTSVHVSADCLSPRLDVVSRPQKLEETASLSKYQTRTMGRWANQYYGPLGELVLRAVGQTRAKGRWASQY